MCKFQTKSHIWILGCLVAISAKNTWADSKDAEFDSVKVKSFVVVDKTGKERVRIGPKKDGVIAISYLDENGKPRAIIDDKGGGIRLVLAGESEKEGIILAVTPKQIVSGIMQNEKTMGLSAADGTQSIEFSNKDGSMAAAIGVDEVGKPVFDGAFSALGAPPTRAISSEPDSRADRRKRIKKNLKRLDDAIDKLEQYQ